MQRRGRTAILSVLILSAIVPVLAQPQAQQFSEAIDKVIFVQSVQVGTPTPASSNSVPIDVRLQNISAKSIYAFKVNIVATWADGSTKSTEWTSDFLALYVWAARDPHPNPPPAIFRSGETHTSQGGVSRAADGSAPISAVATVRMVAFGDRTVIGSHNDVESLSRLRTHQAEQFSGVVEDLQSIVQAADPIKAAEARNKELLALQPGSTNTSGTVGSQISPNNIRAGATLTYVRSVGGDKVRIGKQIADNQAYVQALKLHAVLQEVTE
ncbi:MAG: hypothetical protein ABSF22_15405 [Bryobacteraceae bacterium]